MSLHCYHAYAVKDRVDISSLSDTTPDLRNTPVLSLQVDKVLPSAADEQNMMHNFTLLVARQLCEHLKYFRENFADVALNHITHQYYKEMCKKSHIVSSNMGCVAMWHLLQISLGVQLKDETQHDEMLSILENLQEFVPRCKRVSGDGSDDAGNENGDGSNASKDDDEKNADENEGRDVSNDGSNDEENIDEGDVSASNENGGQDVSKDNDYSLQSVLLGGDLPWLDML